MSTQKTKVSAFEYAIATAAGATEFLATHEPYTREEEYNMRKNDIEGKVKNIYNKMKKSIKP